MNYLTLFDDFDSIEESYNFDSDSLIESKLNQMTGLREGCMAAWDKNEFFQFFTPMINESIDYEERDLVLEKAYITYGKKNKRTS